MPKKRTLWSDQDFDYHDVDKYFEFFDLSLRQEYTDLVNDILRPGNIEGKILDLGCGLGILGMRICSHDEYSTVVALEQSRTLVRAAEVITSRHGYNDRISLKIWQDGTLPFADGEFDAVVSFLALHKWNDPEKILREIERVCKKDGIVYISDFRRDQASIPFKLYVQQVRFEMGKEIAENLKKSFNSAYSAAELKQILERLDLPGYRLEESKTFISIISGIPAKDASTPQAKKAEEEPA
jgi:ubiquinone/menaquinone biosynthesis C-methylase UbiE